MKSFVLTVAVCGILCPVDVAIVINRQEPLRTAEQLSYAHISSLHVVVVPGLSLVSRAVHDSGKLLWGAVTVDHTNTAKQEDRVEAQSREQVLKVPCQHPFVHYSTMQWGSMNNILKCEMAICALSLSQATLCPLTCDSGVPPGPGSSNTDSCCDVETGNLWRNCGGAGWAEGGAQCEDIDRW